MRPLVAVPRASRRRIGLKVAVLLRRPVSWRSAGWISHRTATDVALRCDSERPLRRLLGLPLPALEQGREAVSSTTIKIMPRVAGQLLVRAAQLGRQAVINTLLALPRSHLEADGSIVLTALRWAAAKGHPGAVRAFYAAGAFQKPPVPVVDAAPTKACHAADPRLDEAMSDAAARDHVECLRQFVAAPPDGWGCRVTGKLLQRVVSLGYGRSLQLLCDGPWPVSVADLDTAIQEAVVGRGGVTLLHYLLQRRDALCNGEDTVQERAWGRMVEEAAACGQVEEAMLLCQRKVAQPSLALSFARQHRCLPLVRALCEEAAAAGTLSGGSERGASVAGGRDPRTPPGAITRQVLQHQATCANQQGFGEVAEYLRRVLTAYQP